MQAVPRQEIFALPRNHRHASPRELREWQLEDEIDAWYLQECQRLPDLLHDNYFEQVRRLRNNYRQKIAEIKLRVELEFTQ